ncbi:uncharacterized protein A4U43_C01F36330 [Asparagus officinalis]|uniref:Uncharacterized protein n=1 Tax=Asparagus officinalis TaxID=4686 RepID=A0A5P1FXX2_ASPOF|nr:uncharacterized protein A4U43_C01F36330 [Asparagus officinalis]
MSSPRDSWVRKGSGCSTRLSLGSEPVPSGGAHARRWSPYRLRSGVGDICEAPARSKAWPAVPSASGSSGLARKESAGAQLTGGAEMLCRVLAEFLLLLARPLSTAYDYLTEDAARGRNFIGLPIHRRKRWLEIKLGWASHNLDIGHAHL